MEFTLNNLFRKIWLLKNNESSNMFDGENKILLKTLLLLFPYYMMGFMGLKAHEFLSDFLCHTELDQSTRKLFWMTWLKYTDSMDWALSSIVIINFLWVIMPIAKNFFKMKSNQKEPYYDQIIFAFLLMWLAGLGFKICIRDYSEPGYSSYFFAEGFFSYILVAAGLTKLSTVFEKYEK